MTAAEIVQELKPLGSEKIKKVLLKHGIKEPLLGVKVKELKKIQKRIKKDYQLALDLYDTGIYDAMYLAGLIADDLKMTRKDLQHWVDKATSHALCGYTVAWVAAESLHGWELALEWIESRKEHVAVTGWATLSSLVGIKDDAEFDLGELKRLLLRVQKTLPKAPNRVRHAMNGFVIAVGTDVQPLTDVALQTALKIGAVSVDVGDTSCKVPYAPEYIEKVQKKALSQKAENGEVLSRPFRFPLALHTITVTHPAWIMRIGNCRPGSVEPRGTTEYHSSNGTIIGASHAPANALHFL